MKNTNKRRMKYIQFLLFSLFCASYTTGCGENSITGIPDNWITCSTQTVSFPYEGSSESLSFTLTQEVDPSLLEYTMNNSGEDWCTIIIEGSTLTVQAERSFMEQERSSMLTLKCDDTHKFNISIKQAAAPAADKLIKVISSEATSEETTGKDTEGEPLTLNMSHDGNKKTYYNSKFGIVTYPFYITYTLEEGHILNSIVYTPRTDSGNKWGSFDEFTVEASTTDKPNEFIEIGKYARGNGVHTSFTMKIKNGIANVKQVRFVITKAYENRVSCAEMVFFESSTNKFDPTSIFADEMCTQLKSGVTEKQIKQIPNEYLKQLGLALILGKYDSAYRLASYRPYQHPSVMAEKNKTSKYSLRDNPTGIYASAGEKLIVLTQKRGQGGRVSMLIQDLNGGYNNSKTYDLEEGYNEITAEVGGLIYILNHVTDDIPLLLEGVNENIKKNVESKTVQVHFAMGKVNGYFDIQKNKAADWTNILKNAKYQDIDVLGKYSHLTWKVADFAKNNTEITKTIENCDRLVYLQEEFMGLVKYNKMFNNRMHFCIDYKAVSPNATDYRTVYNASDYYAEPFCVPDRFAARCWGPAHEVGHCNQTRGLKWAGTTEVTNNILSLYTQTSLGRDCKLLVDTCTPKDENNNPMQGSFVNIYEAATQFIVTDKRAHCLPEISNIVKEIQLVPFWQLKLYMMDARNKKDFYRDLFEYFRANDSPTDSGLNQLDFVRQVCAISGLNMLDFFEKWGFLKPVNTTLNDYGNKIFIITQSDIDALKAEINSRGYATPHANVHKITEANVNSYK